jgi:hypothetical protein
MARWIAAAVAIVAIAGGVGCGGSDETTTQSTTGAVSGDNEHPASPESGSDDQQIRATVEKLLTSTDPGQVCKALVTPNYVKSSFGSLKGCEQAAVPGSAARSAKVSGIEIRPGGASAKAVPKGGPSGGEELTVTLAFVRTWKVDGLRSNAPVGP